MNLSVLVQLETSFSVSLSIKTNQKGLVYNREKASAYLLMSTEDEIQFPVFILPSFSADGNRKRRSKSILDFISLMIKTSFSFS